MEVNDHNFLDVVFVRETAAFDMIYVERKTFGSRLSAFYFCVGSLGTQPLSKLYLTN